MRRLVTVFFLLAGMVLAFADALTGSWTFNMDTPGGPRQAHPTFKLDGEQVTGKWDGAEVYGTFKGNDLQLSFPFSSQEGGFSANMKIDGKLEGGQIKGTWIFGDYNGTFTAKKD
jgi:hypothetical protein